MLMLKNRDLKILLGLRIAKLRKIKGFSQEKFAEAINLAQRTLSGIETGANFTQADTLERIADVLELSLGDLLNFNDDYTKEELLDSIIKKVKFMKNDTDKLKTINDFLNKMF